MANVQEDCVIKKIEARVGAVTRKLKEDMQKDGIYRQLLVEKVFGDVEPLAELTNSAVAPEMAWWLYKQAVEKKFDTIVELGSGFSTLVLAKALQANGGGRLFSFEHDYKYYSKTRSNLLALGLEHQVHLVYSPLSKLELEGKTFQWYNITEDFLNNSFGCRNVDFLLIDGPPAKTGRHARHPAYPTFKPYLKEEAKVVLDDGMRDEEKEILSSWLGSEAEKHNSHLIEGIRHAPLMFTHGEKCKLIGPDEGDIAELVKQSLLAMKEQGDRSTAGSEDDSAALGEIIQYTVDQVSMSLERRQDSLKREMAETFSSLEKEVQVLRKKELTLNKKVSRLMLEKQELKSRSSFHIGSAISRNLGGPIKWIRMPKDIYQATISYKENRHNRKLILDKLKALDDNSGISAPENFLRGGGKKT